jgi:hypothetical protein
MFIAACHLVNQATDKCSYCYTIVDVRLCIQYYPLPHQAIHQIGLEARRVKAELLDEFASAAAAAGGTGGAGGAGWAGGGERAPPSQGGVPRMKLLATTILQVPMPVPV